MKPVQLWLPLLNVSWDTPTFSRDIKRAQKNWLGEERIWLLPGLQEVKRWSNQVDDFTLWECAIPSESFNSITVVNISKERVMYPPQGNAIPKDWNGRLPENILNLWLSRSDPDFVGSKNLFKMALPFFTDNKITYKEIDVGFSPGPSIPIAEFHEKKREVVLKWPPEDSKIIDSISPEAESSELFGQYKWENVPTDDDFNTVVNRDGRKAIHTALLWDEPFREMFPFGGGIDLLKHKTDLRLCVKDTEMHKDTIASHANSLNSEGWTNLEDQMVMPALLTKDMEALLFDIEGRFNIEVNSFEELFNHKKYDDVFHTRISVTRIFGWEGYFWWKLNNLVNEEKKSVKICELCGGLISGKKDKVYCNRNENPDCFKRRRAADKRGERNNKRSK